MSASGADPSRGVISTEVVYEGPIFRVFSDQVKLPSGSTAQRDVVRHPGAVGIVAIHQGRVLLVRQHRHALDRELLEIPAGRLDRPGEPPAECAMRELREETGYEAERLIPLGNYLASPGFTDEVYHLYMAEGLRPTGEDPEVDGGEPLVLELMELADARQAIVDGRITDAKSVIAISLIPEHSSSERS